MKTALPKIFEEKASSDVFIADPAKVRRLRHAWSNFWSALIILPGALFLLILFWPVGLILLLIGGYCLKSAIGSMLESRSGRVKEADCPECGADVVFWVTTAFACPHCRKKLLRHEERLYAIE